MRVYQYIEKELETPSKTIATCWRVKGIFIKVPEDIMQIVLVGYKDIDAFINGGIPLDEKIIQINNINEMNCYENTFSEILQKILQHEIFINGQFKTKQVEN